MNKLWIFGDSYSEPFSKHIGVRGWKAEYNDWKGYIPKSYGECVSEKCNLIHFNKAIGGADNYTIFDTIINSLEKIQKNDIIIIGWSDTIRFRVVSNENSFNTIRPGSLDYVLDLNKKAKYLDLSDITLKEISINRDNQIYINELNNYIKLLNFAFSNNKIIHWSPFAQDKNGLNTTLKTTIKYELVRDETNRLIDDGHFTEKSHSILSNQFVDIINNYNFNKLNTIPNSLI